MSSYSYRTTGTCSKEINFELENNIIKNVSFVGGCNGNLKAISKLVEGKTVEEITEILSGITCGFKKTSCGDQLATALKEAYAHQQSANLK